ncbi:MAG: 6-bladed beta-propeller [Muribaculum sp.]|nr:6-bladed beta-propeller [Muribaculum sp.]
MADYITPVAFIELEETDSCLLHDIVKVQQSEGAIYVMDGGADKLYKFNSNGRFISTISNQGQGPNEYINLKDFAVSQSGDSIYICSAPSEIKVFDADGQYQSGYGIDVEAPLTELNISDSGFVMTADNVIESANRLYCLNKDFKVMNSSCPRNTLPAATLCRQSRSNHSTIYFLNWVNNTFYAYDSSVDTITPFMKLYLPNDIETLGIKNFMNFMERQQEVGFVINWSINDNELIVYALSSGKPVIMIWDINKKQILYQGELVDYMPYIHQAYDGKLFISPITYDNYKFFKQGLPNDCGLPTFIEGQTNAILMLWKVT